MVEGAIGTCLAKITSSYCFKFCTLNSSGKIDVTGILQAVNVEYHGDQRASLFLCRNNLFCWTGPGDASGSSLPEAAKTSAGHSILAKAYLLCS